ncbi:unnamed protein product [Oppiella nova]|uniref:Uncharacterized protein n=1 Tax=Oppiella nova TaxID=334625 RepID=A0A7R9QU55_9ACAR|nr:unnamed protein product [Oppiella nova]CAG2174130.1 unnamed protein product [Oppiella nova]
MSANEIVHTIVVCHGIKTEKELADYFKFMTESMTAMMPVVDHMIESETNPGMKSALKKAKKHIEDLIKKKAELQKQCKDHKKSLQECCKMAEDMRTEMQQAFANEINNHKH